MKTELEDARITYEALMDHYLIDADYADGEYNDDDWKLAKYNAFDDFEQNFDSYNNWVAEDDYDNESEWEYAKREFIINFKNYIKL